MKSPNPHLYVLSLLFSVSILLNCTRNSPSEVKIWETASEKCFGGFSIKGLHNLAARNPIGAIYIYGNGLPDTVRTYLWKTVKAVTKETAALQFDNILFQNNSVNDSSICQVSAPFNPDNFEYTCTYTLEIFGKIQTFVKSPNSGVSISYMDTTVNIRDSMGNLEIKKHNGSCDVSTSKGNISVEMIFIKNGFCRCFTAGGNIILEIPQNSSAAIYAQTDAGKISCNNLNISDKQQSTGLLTGKLADGAGEIHLETQKGDIVITGFDTRLF